MYATAAWPSLAAALAALEHFDRATPEQKELIEGVFGAFFDASLYAVFSAVTCNDSPWPRDPARYVRLSAALGSHFPLLGYSWLAQPCAFWPYKSQRPQRITGAGLPTMLMINSTHDPATPYEGAVLAHRSFRNSRLVTVVNDGDHGQLGGGNPCVDSIGLRFFVQGVVPAHDTVCQGLPLPVPTAAAAAARAAAAGKQNVLQLTRDLTRRHQGALTSS